MDFYIPPPYWEISAFRQTLGHKINHSFKNNNTKFGRAYNPRFGNVRAIVASKDIMTGQEVLTDYGYQIGSHVPQWYSDLYKKEIGLNWYNKQRQNQRLQQQSSKHVKKHQQQEQQCTLGK